MIQKDTLAAGVSFYITGNFVPVICKFGIALRQRGIRLLCSPVIGGESCEAGFLLSLRKFLQASAKTGEIHMHTGRRVLFQEKWE